MRAVLAGLLGSLVWAAPAAAQLPRATITDGPSGEVRETTATFAFQASGPAPLGSFECRLDGAAWQSCQSPKTYEKLTGGPHVFAVRLTGPLTDSTADERRWVVAQRTEVTPPPLPPPPPPPDSPRPPDPPPQPPRDAPRRDAYGCAYAGNRVGEVLDARLERAAICVINHQRAKRDLVALRPHAQLRRAAARHSADMVERSYFSHVAPGGRRLRDRVRSSGYLDGATYWTLGEVLAWQRAPAPTPAGTVRAWMRSPSHKRTLLIASFREIGVAFAHGTPVGGRGGATWAANMGHRG